MVLAARCCLFNSPNDAPPPSPPPHTSAERIHDRSTGRRASVHADARQLNSVHIQGI